MKNRNWFIVSLAFNAFFLSTFVVSSVLRYSSETLPPSNDPSLSARTDSAIADRPSPPFPTVAQTGESSGEDWQPWLQQLRAAGVPEKVLAGLVESDFENSWEKQRREIQARYESGDVDDHALASFNEKHDAEQEEELKLALGEDGFRRWDEEKVLHDLDLAKLNLSSGETDQLYELRKALAGKQHDLEQKWQNGELDEYDYNQQQVAAQKDYDQQFKTLLGDQRYTAVQTPDASLGSLRRELKNIDATDAQFAALADAQQQWNEQSAELERQIQENPSQSDAYQQQMQALNAARDQAFQTVLGANGVALLQEQQDGRYQTMKQYAPAWNLSDDDINYLYSSIQCCQQNISDYQQQAQALQQQGQAVDWDAVQKNIQQFTEQTQADLRNYLGDDRFNKLKRSDVFSFNN